CPICRVGITVPRDGATAFPPAFIVNQLLDLLASQRRDLVPKCRLHPSQELLFCETCDVVFCADCRGRGHATQPCGGSDVAAAGSSIVLDESGIDARTIMLNTLLGTSRSRALEEAPCGNTNAMPENGSAGSSQVGGAALSHNVISFNVAIKRCSEILLYKAHLCIQELNSAQEAVAAELDRLTENRDLCETVRF
ncbi:unnamed protein product, partial [Protopolystoma xenopodis]